MKRNRTRIATDNAAFLCERINFSKGEWKKRETREFHSKLKINVKIFLHVVFYCSSMFACPMNIKKDSQNCIQLDALMLAQNFLQTECVRR